MMTRRDFVSRAGQVAVLFLAGIPIMRAGRSVFAAGDGSTIRVYSAMESGYITMEKVIKSEDEWKKILTKEQFRILRKKGTEKAFTHPLNDNKKKGVYKCAGCGLDLFSSEHKFDSGTGWPSFWQPIAPENIATEEDVSWFMKRTEVHCPRCGGHQGHVFEDGPKPTGLRYCINGLALVFVPENEIKAI